MANDELVSGHEWWPSRPYGEVALRTTDPSKAPRILESAAQLFAERPYHEVRMDEIAARAGVAKGTLYLHFKDKEALYLALIEDGMKRQMFDTLAHLSNVVDPFERLHFIIRAAIVFFEKYPHLLNLLPSLDAKLPNNPEIPLRARKEEFLGLIRGVLTGIDATGRLKVADPAFSALCLVGLLYELLKSTPRPWPEQLAERMAGSFLYGVRGQPE
jgi:AcrR family transcriptional regulator